MAGERAVNGECMRQWQRTYIQQLCKTKLMQTNGVMPLHLTTPMYYILLKKLPTLRYLERYLERYLRNVI